MKNGRYMQKLKDFNLLRNKRDNLNKEIKQLNKNKRKLYIKLSLLKKEIIMEQYRRNEKFIDYEAMETAIRFHNLIKEFLLSLMVE